MSTETKETVATEEGLAVVLPQHLTENFEKAEREIREFYGLSPGVPALVRLWAGNATSSRIRKAFELLALDIKNRGLSPREDEYFDDDEP